MKIKKIITLITAALLSVSLTACGETDTGSTDIYDNFKGFIEQSGMEENYYIQISKTAAADFTLIEASKYGTDCAFMESDASSTLKFFRNGTLTVYSAENYFVPKKTDAQWPDFEFNKINEKSRGIVEELLRSDTQPEVSSSENDSKDMPYSISLKYAPGELDTKALFSSGGNFGSVSIKAKADKEYQSFESVSLNYQYDYDGVIYLYGVTFGDPAEPDENGNNGHRPEDISALFKQYSKNIEDKMTAT